MSLRSKTRKLLIEALAQLLEGMKHQQAQISHAEATLPLMRERLEDMRKAAADIEHDLANGDPTREADDAA